MPLPPQRAPMAAAAACALALALAAAALPRPAAAWHQCNAQALYAGPYGYQAIGNLSDYRNSLLGKLWPFVGNKTMQDLGWQRYDVFNPTLACPPNQPLRRVGSTADGGKLICDLGRLRPPCVIYSLGSQGDYSFERDMLRLTQCEVHTFDCTYNGRSQGERHFYHKTCLGLPTAGPDFKTYDALVRELGHGAVDFLKIDIEGHEPNVLASLVANRGPLPRQVAIEMHMRDAVAGPAPVSMASMGLLFYHLAALGYGIVAREDNLWGVKGCCAEFTFLHVEVQHRHGHHRAAVAAAAGDAAAAGAAASAVVPLPRPNGKALDPETPLLVTLDTFAVVGTPAAASAVPASSAAPGGGGLPQLPPPGVAAAALGLTPGATAVPGVTVLPAGGAGRRRRRLWRLRHWRPAAGGGPGSSGPAGARRDLLGSDGGGDAAAPAAAQPSSGTSSSSSGSGSSSGSSSSAHHGARDGGGLLAGESRRWGSQARWLAVGTWSGGGGDDSDASDAF